jgi:Fe-S-cluster-containing hydrogenase component 2
MQYSNCFHGTLSPVIMRNTLKYFRDEYDEHALRHRCPTKTCAGLIRYRVANQSVDVAAAADICPTDAIVRDPHGAWTIDDARCIRCNACKERAPSDISIDDRYGDTIPLQTVVRANVAPAQVPVLPRP